MKIGDYVRTKNGIIGRIETKNYIGYSDWLIDTLYYNDDGIINDWTCGIKEYNIIKSSPYIIDLLMVGDFVNGSYIQKIKEIKNNEMTCMLDSDYESYSHIKNEDIESVLTKEQFENMEYKVGESNESN